MDTLTHSLPLTDVTLTRVYDLIQELRDDQVEFEWTWYPRWHASDVRVIFKFGAPELCSFYLLKWTQSQ